MISSVREPLATPQAVGRRIERLRNDNGFRLLQRAKAHLWTDWLYHGSENEGAIEFLSEFILCYAKLEEIGHAARA